MKKLTILAVLFALSASLLTGCRFGRGNNTTTTTKDRHTLPGTTGATITTPTEGTTRQTHPTMPSTDHNDHTGTDGHDTTNGTNSHDTTNGTDGTIGTEPGTNGKSRSRHPGKY